MITEDQRQERIRFQIIGQKMTEFGGQLRIALRLLGSVESIWNSAEEGANIAQGNAKSILNVAFDKWGSALNEDCFWLVDQTLAADWISMAALIGETDALDLDVAIFELGSPSREYSLNSTLPLVRRNVSAVANGEPMNRAVRKSWAIHSQCDHASPLLDFAL